MIDEFCSTVREAVHEAARFERVAADFYGMLARRFAYIPDVAVFWQGMRDEELEHERAVLSVLHSLSPEALEFPPRAELCEGIISVSRLLKTIVGYDIKDLDDAYELAHQLEFSEVNSILKLWLTQINPKERTMEQMVTVVDEHQEKLLSFDENFGSRHWRKMQKILPE